MPSQRYDEEISLFPAGRLNGRETRGIRRLLKNAEFLHDLQRRSLLWLGYASAAIASAAGIAKWLLPHIKV